MPQATAGDLNAPTLVLAERMSDLIRGRHLPEADGGRAAGRSAVGDPPARPRHQPRLCRGPRGARSRPAGQCARRAAAEGTGGTVKPVIEEGTGPLISPLAVLGRGIRHAPCEASRRDAAAGPRRLRLLQPGKHLLDHRPRQPGLSLRSGLRRHARRATRQRHSTHRCHEHAAALMVAACRLLWRLRRAHGGAGRSRRGRGGASVHGSVSRPTASSSAPGVSTCCVRGWQRDWCRRSWSRRCAS